MLTETTFQLSHPYADNGPYEIIVTVEDQAGHQVSDTASVHVTNGAPIIDSGLEPTTISVGDTFGPTVYFTDQGDDSWDVTINYGDLSAEETFTVSATDFQLSHPYADPGTFTVTVTVTDDDDEAAIATAEVVVEADETVIH